MIKIITSKDLILAESPLNYPWECKDDGHKWGGVLGISQSVK